MAEISPRENPDFEQALISLMDRCDRLEEELNQLSERVKELEDWQELMMR
jgi:uncharacterized protein (UPF0335 family)